MKTQVTKEHYSFQRYTSLQRWASYWYQIKEITALDIETVLEVGPGEKVFGNYLSNNCNLEYKSMDIASDLNPDFIGNLNSIPIKDNSFDVVCAFQVLEHIPYDQFEVCLKEMSRVSKKYVMFSLPHYGSNINFSLKLPFFRQMRFNFKIFSQMKHIWDGQHYWEIGKKNFEYQKVKKVIAEVLDIVHDFVPFENNYHHFFVCKIK